MAKNEPEKFAIFDQAARHIMDTFEFLIKQLIERRNDLLKILQDMKDEYLSKESNRVGRIKELEMVQEQMEEMNLKFNPNISLLQSSLTGYKQEQRILETTTELPHAFFSCNTLSELRTQIAEFGQVKECVDYSLKNHPVLAIGKRGSANNELRARGLAICDTNGLIYVADYENRRVQIISYEGKFLRRFGQDILRGPWGIATAMRSIYVTDRDLHALFRFCMKDYKLIGRVGIRGSGKGQLCYPRGVSVDYNGEVYVADYDNNRISIYSKELNFKDFLGAEQLKFPEDVKFSFNYVVVLDHSTNCVHFYSRNGELINSCVTQGLDGIVHSPAFFCLDAGGNILMSDWLRHDIKVFSTTGQLVHKIGKEGHRKGELYSPYGVSISELGTLYVISFNANFSLQSF